MTKPLLLVALLFSVAGSVEAQPDFGVDVGAVIPVMEFAERRSAGASVTASAGIGTGSRGLGARAELSWQRVYDAAPVGDVPPRGDFTALSARGTLLYTFSDNPTSVYGLFGAGVYDLEDEGYENPYGTLFGTHLGLGLTLPAGPVRLNVESQIVTLLTDYGSGPFHFPTTYFPVTVGVRF